MDPLSSIFGQKVAGTRVVPMVTKIVTLFSIFLLVSSFASNYINLMLNQGEELGLANRLLVKDLAELYGFAANQAEIYDFSGNLQDAVKSMEQSALKDLQAKHSVAFAVRKDGSLLFWASQSPGPQSFTDMSALERLSAAGTGEGRIEFTVAGYSYFGVFKYNDKWGVWLVRAEERSEFNAASRAIFARVAVIIVILTLVCIIVGALLVRRILRFLGNITQDLMRMQKEQRLGLLDLGGAPNDEVSYMGASFNSLSSTIDNLMQIFRRFVTMDIAQRAYREKEVRLEGTSRQLTILFSDIKSFTTMTETLGNDIIDLLNLHYQRAITRIHENNGIVGSIIGDALLAVFGTLEGDENKSLQSLAAAYAIQEVASGLRKEISEKCEAIVARRGGLTDAEERVYRVVLLEVGVGIDGGEVFYGNIGSYERMANTVIGDNVNSASRLEGLTRIYRVPVVCSEYIKKEVEGCCDKYRFLELDKVQVKGKTEGKRIYWPIRIEYLDAALEAECDAFERGLASYYSGDWPEAIERWKPVTLPLVEVFRERVGGASAPKEWNGIWAMTTK